MIIGIGVDLVKIDRFNTQDVKFIKKILTENELALFHERKSEKRKLEFIAGRYAAKEAFSKAYGTGIGVLKFHDIEVLADSYNKPIIEFDDYNVQISITHTDSDACAFVIIEKK